jgi:hypothetical protein
VTQQQAATYLQSVQATFVSASNGVEWWRLPNGGFVGKRALTNGLFELRSFGAGSCNC